MSSEQMNTNSDTSIKFDFVSKPLLPPKESIDFESLPWNLNLPEEHYYLHLTTTTNHSWDDEKDEEYYLSQISNSFYKYSTTDLSFRPATTSLNYGTTIWEGLKCYRSHRNHNNNTNTSDNNDNKKEDDKDDEIVYVFRPELNYERMKQGAEAMCLPMPSKKLFLTAIQSIIQRNSFLIPPVDTMGCKLYIRPMLLGSGQQLGLHPSTQFSFIIYVSPTGSYFGRPPPPPQQQPVSTIPQSIVVSQSQSQQAQQPKGLQLHLETKRIRAVPGGLGAVKCAGNYGAALKPLMDCKKYSFQDNLFVEYNQQPLQQSQQETSLSKDVDIKNKLNNFIVQEMSAANVFFVLKTGEIVTPSLHHQTILPGVTRHSVLQLIHLYPDELVPYMVDSIQQHATATVSKGVTGTGETTSSESMNMTMTRVFGTSRDITVGEIQQNAIEAFCTGTAAEIVPIARIATCPELDSDYYYYNDDNDDHNTDANEKKNGGGGGINILFHHGQTIPGGPVTTKLLRMMHEAMHYQRCQPQTREEIDESTVSSSLTTTTTTTTTTPPPVNHHTTQWVRDPFGTNEEFCS